MTDKPINSEEIRTEPVYRTTHMCLSIRGALRNWTPRQMKGMLIDDNGRKLSADEVREYLMDRLAEGKKVIPCGPICEGFSYETGCPGHVQEGKSE